MNSQIINFKFLKENIKKSIGVILFSSILIAIFSLIILSIVAREMNYNRIYIPNMLELSIPALIGMYIVPILISIALFNFVFKKNSVDFICAMPIKKATIFCTNTLGGLIIFAITFLITAILIFLVGIMSPKLLIPLNMFFYYFITWFLTYSFVFIVSNLAGTITGNIVVQIALTFLLIFLPGYMSDYYNSYIYNASYINTTNKYFQINDAEAPMNTSVIPYKYARIIPTAMFNYYYSSNSDSELQNVYNFDSMLKMTILSIVGFALGLILFMKRKMEVAENTFLSQHTHNLVKCIIVFPFIIGGLRLLNSLLSEGIIIILAIIVAIYFIYDLITKKSLQGLKKSLIYLVGVLIIAVLFNFVAEEIAENKAREIIHIDEVSSVGITTDYGGSGRVLNYKITNEEIISFIFNVNKSETNSKYYGINVKLNLKNNKSYSFKINLDESKFDNLLDLLSNDEGYVSNYRNIPTNKVIAILALNNDRNLKDEYLEELEYGFKNLNIKDAIKNYMIREQGEPYGYEYSGNINAIKLDLYAFDKGEYKIFNIAAEINPALLRKLEQNGIELIPHDKPIYENETPIEVM